jgi:hypothetical protein
LALQIFTSQATGVLAPYHSMSHLSYFGKAAKINEGEQNCGIKGCFTFSGVFLTGNFAPWFQTNYPSILPQMIFGVLFIGVLQIAKEYGYECPVPRGLGDFHSLLGTFLGLIVSHSLGSFAWNITTLISLLNPTSLVCALATHFQTSTVA